MNLDEDWDDQSEEDEWDLDEELDLLVKRRSVQENVAVAREHISIFWHRHGDQAQAELEAILRRLASLAKQSEPAEVLIDFDLDGFEESYIQITGDLYSSEEIREDLTRFREAMESHDNMTKNALVDCAYDVFDLVSLDEELSDKILLELHRSVRKTDAS